jgi:protein DGCR14
LNQFQAKFTSEDNQSFDLVLEKVNQDRRQKYKWVYDQVKLFSGPLIASSITDNDNDNDGSHSSASLLSSESKAKNTSALMAVEGSVSLNSATTTTPDTRKGVPSTWKYTARNSFMYTPNGYGNNTSTVEERLSELGLFLPEKEILYSNTRIHRDKNSSLRYPPPLSLQVRK